MRPEGLNANGSLFGRISLTMKARVRNMITRRSILSIDKIVFVGVDEAGTPIPHGYSTIAYDRDRMPEPHGKFS
ncbi:hypothetical protein [Brevibacterium siliguriense]|uniref:hypothetical protein n=1 Tax=Brevibacterium siliguriense TaxID=1136497 RepID=UPI000B81056F|nr:hypothetical protein [Brevibacterium siliguriense]